MKRSIFIGLISLYGGFALAGDGPCGIELGTWARNIKACKRLSRGDLGNDQNGWMVFRPGARWEQWETFCQIKAPELKNDICNYMIICRGEEGSFDEKESMRIIDRKNIAFIYGSTQLPYIYCGPPIKTPYSSN